MNRAKKASRKLCLTRYMRPPIRLNPNLERLPGKERVKKSIDDYLAGGRSASRRTVDAVKG
jgi:hypothetical protein